VAKSADIPSQVQSRMLLRSCGVRSLSKYGLEQVTVEQTDHYKVMREFCDDPPGFVEVAIAE
jgi:predicted ATPase